MTECALAVAGHRDEGVGELEMRFAKNVAKESKQMLPYAKASLADTLSSSGRVEDGCDVMLELDGDEHPTEVCIFA